jgi:pilus assembly protein CpaB
MNKSVLMIMGGALVVAIIVAMLVQAKLSPKEKTAAAPTAQILVAKRNLAIGSTLSPEDVEWRLWPEQSMFKGVIKKADQPDEKKLEVYDSPLRRNIESGEPITKQSLVPDIKGGNNFLAATIAPGMRAVAIPVKANTMAGGFIMPGDRVDVILSYSPELPDGAEKYSSALIQRYASEAILRDVRVLAVDQRAKEEEDQKAKVAKTVTLEVNPEGAQILALADRMGEMTLSLRRIGEKDKADTNYPLTTDMLSSDVVRRLSDMVGGAQMNGGTVRLYSGSTVMNVPVRPAAQDDAGKAGTP